MSRGNESRLIWADLLRTAALVAALMVWTARAGLAGTTVGTGDWRVFQVYDSLLCWCVPAFAMLSGMFLLDPKRSLNLPRLLGGHILRVVTAIVLWGVIYGVTETVLAGGGLTWGGFLAALRRVVSGETGEYLWFLYIILGLYLVTPVLLVFVRGASRGDFHLFFLLSFVVAFLLPALLEVWPNQAVARWLDRMEIHLVLGAVSYYLLGYYLKNWTLNRPAEYLIYLLGVLGAVVTVGGTWLLSLARGTWVRTLCGLCSPSVALTALAVGVLFRYLLGVSEERSRRQRASSSARIALGIYGAAGLAGLLLSHWGISVFALPPVLAVPVLAAVLFLAGFVVAWLISKIPLVGRYLT